MNAKQGQRWGIIMVLAGFVVGIPGVYVLLEPNRFEATARVQVVRSATDIPPAPVNGGLTYDPYFINNAIEGIKSEVVLSEVVEKLHLDSDWGNKYANGRKLELAETLGLLKQSLHLRAVRNTMLIDIGVISEDSTESAKIANAITEAYRDFCRELRAQRKDTTDPLVIYDSVSIIVDLARPDSVPIGPNRTLGKALIGIGVLLLFGGFVTFVRHWRLPEETPNAKS